MNRFINTFYTGIVRKLPVETSTATRNKELHDGLVKIQNWIPFVRASTLDEAGSLKSETWKPKIAT